MGIVSPGELAVGMYVTVVDEKEVENGYKEADIFMPRQQSQYAGWIGIPFQIRAICLPFVMGQVIHKGGLFGPSTSSSPLDTRKVNLMQVSAEFYNIYAGHERPTAVPAEPKLTE